MECTMDGGKNGDFIILDPYLFPAAHAVRLVGLWGNAASTALAAFMFWHPWFLPSAFRLKGKLCFWYMLLTCVGSSVEALATTLLSENDAW